VPKISNSKPTKILTDNRDLICALATPPARSAIAIIRASGGADGQLFKKIAPYVKSRIAVSAMEPRRAYHVSIHDETGAVIDDVVFLRFEEPASFTGEDAMEIHSHGNPLIAKNILNLLYSCGFREAKPGEFTRRAYLNGKIDLDAAEAIREIIDAKSHEHLSAAQRLKSGGFKTALYVLRSELMNLLADQNAELDFIDEDISFSAQATKVKLIADQIAKVQHFADGAEALDAFRDGINIAIVGAPNAGKSSLMNRLLGQDRSIVSDIAGTTRDYIEAELTIGGYPVRLFDTAGLRSGTNDAIEIEGQQRTRELMAKAHIVVALLDGSEQPHLSAVAAHLVAINKSDQLAAGWLPGELFISAKTGAGLEEFKTRLESEVKARSPSGAIALGAWQINLLRMIEINLAKVQSAYESNEAPEITAHILQQTVNRIAELTGEITNEDILGRIFSRFCIGK